MAFATQPCVREHVQGLIQAVDNDGLPGDRYDRVRATLQPVFHTILHDHHSPQCPVCMTELFEREGTGIVILPCGHLCCEACYQSRMLTGLYAGEKNDETGLINFKVEELPTPDSEQRWSCVICRAVTTQTDFVCNEIRHLHDLQRNYGNLQAELQKTHRKYLQQKDLAECLAIHRDKSHGQELFWKARWKSMEEHAKRLDDRHTKQRFTIQILEQQVKQLKKRLRTRNRGARKPKAPVDLIPELEEFLRW